MLGLLRVLPWYLLLAISTAEAVLVNVTVDDSAPDPVTGRVLKYLPPLSWKSGNATCTDCTATVGEGSMFNRTWHEGTYFPNNSALSSTGSLSTTFTFNGTAIYVFCALALSVSNPTGYSNMSFFIDNEPVGRFERFPPGQQDFQYNVSVYVNTSIPAGVHLFRLQNGPSDGNLGNESLTLFDYLVYSYDDGEPTTATSSSSSTSSTASASSSPEVRSSSPAGAIAGGVVGGIVGLLLLIVLLWFLRRRSRAHMLNEKGHSHNSMSPTNNNTIPDPFTESEPSPTRLPKTSAMPTAGYGIGVRKNDISQEQHITSGNTSSAPSSAVNPSSSGSPPASAEIPGRPARLQETDAGPIVLERQNGEEDTLPPQYGQVFASSSTSAAPQPSTGGVPT